MQLLPNQTDLIMVRWMVDGLRNPMKSELKTTAVFEKISFDAITKGPTIYLLRGGGGNF